MGERYQTRGVLLGTYQQQTHLVDTTINDTASRCSKHVWVHRADDHTTGQLAARPTCPECAHIWDKLPSYSVRIKQVGGGWAGVDYLRTLQQALEVASKHPTRDYSWAIFHGRNKVVDSATWVPPDQQQSAGRISPRVGEAYVRSEEIREALAILHGNEATEKERDTAYTCAVRALHTLEKLASPPTTTIVAAAGPPHESKE